MEKSIQLVKEDPKDTKRTLANAPNEPAVGFDYPDLLKAELSMTAIPEEERGAVLENAKKTASALLKEGATGATALRLLSRDVALRRIAVSQADALVALMREQMKRNSGIDEHRKHKRPFFVFLT